MSSLIFKFQITVGLSVIGVGCEIRCVTHFTELSIFDDAGMLTGYFNRAVDWLPQSLLHLKLGKAFDKSLNFLPQSLKKLTLDGDGYLEFSCTYTKDFRFLPESITQLYLKRKIGKITVLPPKLEVLAIGLAISTEDEDRV